MFDFVETTAPSRAAPASVALEDAAVARLDPALCLMPGLFRYRDPAWRDQSLTALRLKYEFGDYTIEVHGSAPLGGDALPILQGQLALAGALNETIDPTGALSDIEAQLVEGITPPATAKYKFMPAVDPLSHCSYSESNLLELIGWSVCGENRTRLRKGSQQLATLTFIRYPTKNPREWTRYNLQSLAYANTQSRKWARTHAAFDPYGTMILLGSKIRYTYIDMETVRLIGQDQALSILNGRLSAWIDPGRTREVKLGTLLEYLFPDDEVSRYEDAARRSMDREYAKLSAADIKRKQMKVLQDALNGLSQLPGWFAAPSASLAYEYQDHLTDLENEAAEAEHNRACVAAARRGKQDVLETLVTIKRAKLRKA